MLPAREDRMWIRNAWYVAAWTHEIERGRIHARTIIDQPLVLYRTTDNGIVALEDRCPHRFAPLSLGRLEGDALRCMYHGLKFAPDGRCIEIPGQERIPQSACVRRFPLQFVDRLADQCARASQPVLFPAAARAESVSLSSPERVRRLLVRQE